MSTPDRYYAAACQIDSPSPRTRDGIAPRVRRMLEMIDFAVGGYQPFFDVRLIVFGVCHARDVNRVLVRLDTNVDRDHPLDKIYPAGQG